MSVQVLVANDEALIRQSLRATLAREGFDVSVAAVAAMKLGGYDFIKKPFERQFATPHARAASNSGWRT